MVLLKMRHKVLDEPASSLHLFGAAETAPSDLSSRFVGNEGETRETARRRALRVEMPRDRARGGAAGLRARVSLQGSEMPTAGELAARPVPFRLFF